MFFLSLLPFFISNQLSRRNLSIESTRHFRRNLPEIEEKWFSSSGIGGNNRTWSGFTCLSFDNLSQSLSLPPPDRVLFEYIIELCSPIEHTYEHPSILAKNEVDNELCTSLSVRAVLYTHFQTQLFRPIRSMKPYRTIFCNINLFAEKIENDNDADLYISFRIHFSLLLLEARTWPTSTRGLNLLLPPSKLRASSWTLLARDIYAPLSGYVELAVSLDIRKE